MSTVLEDDPTLLISAWRQAYPGFQAVEYLYYAAKWSAAVRDHPDWNHTQPNSYMVVAGTLTKTTGTSEGVVAGLAETVSNDTGNADLLDPQYVAFNLMTLICFFSAFFGTTAANPPGWLPSIPPTLLALSRVSAAAYVTKKTLEKGTAPQVLGVAPRLAVLGHDIYFTVTGAGFCPSGTPTALNAVTVGRIPVAADSWSDTQVIASLPATSAAAQTLGLQEGSQSLVVTDETGNDSDPYLIPDQLQPGRTLGGHHGERTTI